MTATIEDVKKFWNDRPCNVRHSSKEVGTLEYFNEVSNKKFFVEPHIIDFTDFASWRSKKVLEVGCGRGHLLARLAKHGLDVIGVDKSTQMVNAARKRLRKANLSGQVICADAKQIPLPDASIGTI